MFLPSLVVSAVAVYLGFLLSQWVPGRGREQFRDVRLGKISDPKAANVFCIFVLRFACHGENSSFLAHLYCQRVWGIRPTAFNGGPRTGRVAQSTSKFVVLSLFFVEKRGPNFDLIFWPRLRGQKLGPL